MNDIAELDEPRREIVTLPPSEITPLFLIQTALQQNIDPERLGRLMDLQERYERNAAVAAYNHAMADAQKSMPLVIKDAENTFTHKKYASLEAVNSAIKPVYSKHGFSLSFGTEESKLDGHIRMFVDVRHALGHVVRYHGDFPLDDAGAQGASNKTGIQATGSTYSYGRRYLTLLAFNVATGEDNDGNSQTQFITTEQIGEINDLREELETMGKPMTWPRFLAWLGVESLENLPAADFTKAIHEMNRHRRKPIPAKVETPAPATPAKKAGAK